MEGEGDVWKDEGNVWMVRVMCERMKVMCVPVNMFFCVCVGVMSQ